WARRTSRARRTSCFPSPPKSRASRRSGQASLPDWVIRFVPTSTIVPPARSTRRHARLVRRLRAAQASLAQWEDSLRALAAGPAPDSPHNAAELLSIVNQAKLGLNQLL